jgi:hypothetical protein
VVPSSWQRGGPFSLAGDRVAPPDAPHVVTLAQSVTHSVGVPYCSVVGAGQLCSCLFIGAVEQAERAYIISLRCAVARAD